jgi:hypothetical protein
VCNNGAGHMGLYKGFFFFSSVLEKESEMA